MIARPQLLAAIRCPGNRLGKRLHVGIFGPSLCGKTNVAKWLVLTYWLQFRIRSVVLDPKFDQVWPACALRFYNAERFWEFIARSRGLAVFADDMGTDGRQKSLVEFFTCGRHNHHVVHVMGHRISNLLPEMRDQLQTLFLFDQSPTAAKLWAEEWADERLREAAGLPQYEFLWAEKYGDALTRRHAITHGIFPQFLDTK